jgi:NADPH:quinone reductase-like Zn-dependent oxidoreductase
MTLARKILGIVFVLIALAVVSLAITLSYDSACGDIPALASDAQRMQAIVYHCYGSPDVLKLEDVEMPVPADNEVLVKVHAASVNPLDWHYMRGSPYIMRMESGIGAPTNPRLGVDYSGTVVAVGKDVTRFQTGDEVYGGKNGAFAEYLSAREDRSIVRKPPNITFAQAAAVPIAALTALQSLRDHGQLKAGQKVLINGASGGVGTFAVQIAKSMGAEVTGVCSTRNIDMVRSLGADHVIDYTQENFTKGAVQYDLVLDMVGNHSLLTLRDVMKPDGILVIVGGSSEGNFLGAMTRPINALLLSPFVSQTMGMMLAELNPEDLAVMSELMQSGKVTPVIDRSYSLSETPEAIRYVEAGHSRGKVIISLQPNNSVGSQWMSGTPDPSH